MKKFLLLPVLLAAAVIGITGCDTGNTDNTTTATSPDIGFAREREGDDAYAIDKINVDPLPENAWYNRKYLEGIEIIGDKWDCNIYGKNYNDQFQDLDKYADTAMAGLVTNYKYMSTTLEWEEPVHTTVAGYDAVLYNFTLREDLWVTDTEGRPVTNEKKEGTSYVGRRFAGRGYFFFSGTDAYYIIFTCNQSDLSECAPVWDQILANVKVDEDLKISDITTVEASYTFTDM